MEDFLRQAAEHWLDGHINMDLSPAESMVGVLAKVMGDRMRSASTAMELAGCPASEITEFERRYQLWMYETLTEMYNAFGEDIAAASGARMDLERQLNKVA